MKSLIVLRGLRWKGGGSVDAQGRGPRGRGWTEGPLSHPLPLRFGLHRSEHGPDTHGLGFLVSPHPTLDLLSGGAQRGWAAGRVGTATPRPMSV